MQTFLTHSHGDFFGRTARTLDNKRLNKQALEAWQIMMTNLKLDPAGNHREPRGWFNHPATKMWRGHEIVLGDYINAMCDEWRSRGFKTTIGDKAVQTLNQAHALGRLTSADAPSWLLNAGKFSKICSSHRVALLCKNYDWYTKFGWSEDSGIAPDGYDYVWGAE